MVFLACAHCFYLDDGVSVGRFSVYTSYTAIYKKEHNTYIDEALDDFFLKNATITLLR